MGTEPLTTSRATPFPAPRLTLFTKVFVPGRNRSSDLIIAPRRVACQRTTGTGGSQPVPAARDGVHLAVELVRWGAGLSDDQARGEFDALALGTFGTAEPEHQAHRR